MAVSVGDVLSRRSDLSTFVVHLTKKTEQSAKKNLESILDEYRIEARTAMGWASDQDDPDDPEQQTQRVVSFTETPLEHIHSHVADIAGRRESFEPYGIAMTKLSARRIGINPVWYVDMTVGRTWAIAKALKELKDEAVSSGSFHEHPVAEVLPFIEQMGDWRESNGALKEFWWEREWRNRGDVG